MARFQQWLEFLETRPLPVLLILIYVLYLCALAIYRLYISPVAYFPGSKLTAVTGWYETYLDVWKGGQFGFQIEKWHHQFGPIIRINPTELHISDPDFHSTIYSSSTRFNKIKAFKHRSQYTESTQATVEHDLHHIRRAALNPYFSKRQVVEFAPYIQSRAEKLCDRLLNEYKGTSTAVVLNEAWAAYATDNVFFYCFARSYDFLSYPHFLAPFTTSLRWLMHSFHVMTHFPWVVTLTTSIPQPVLATVNRAMQPVFQFQNEVRTQILEAIKNKDEARKNEKTPTVFNELLKSNLPPEELSPMRLEHEAAVIIGAGIETTMTILSVACFYILNEPEIYQQLHQELVDAWPDVAKAPTFTELERLPYLTAVIQESLRMGYGVSQRLPRTSTSPLQYKSYSIPPGTPFSMTNYIVHHTESVFPSSHTFLPSRWLNNPKVGANADRPLSRYMVSFSTGTRNCLGMHLAYVELYIGLANVFRKLNLELWETERDAVDMASEYLVPMPKAGTKGVRVLVK